MQQGTPAVLVNQSFSDMSTLGDAIEWELDFRQIEAGKLDARALLIAGVQNLILRVEFNRKFHQRGCPPPEVITFGFPDFRIGPLRWNGESVEAGSLLNFNNGRLDGVNPRNLAGYTLSFPLVVLEDVADVVGIELDVAGSLRAKSFWPPEDAEHDLLRSNLRLLEIAGKSMDESEQRLKETRELLDFDLAVSVVRILGHGQRQVNGKTASFRAAARRRALEWIDDPEQLPVSVPELCRSVGASQATLARAFAEEFGVSPKRYMRAKLLTSVRHDLLRSNAGILIADIANRYDFWHMGRFAAEYKKQFGELPSETQRLHHA